jgi:prepilin-type N-terminal cleavage/methylation domain-containing protein
MLIKNGYTLVELVIVIAIIGLLAVFGIPAFERYGNYSKLDQKSEEVKQFIAKTQLLARNPENTDIKNYIFVINGSTFEIQKCETDSIGIGDCTITDNLNNQAEFSIQRHLTDPAQYLVCPTAPDKKCSAYGNLSILYSTSGFTRTVVFDTKTAPIFSISSKIIP